MKTRWLSMTAALALSFSLCGALQADAAPDLCTSAAGTITYNEGMQNYTRYGTVVNSYLYTDTDGMLVRAENTADGILIEKYDTDFSLLSSDTIAPELAFFGGFYSGAEYNFLVFGAENSAEDDSCEVVRAVKYSKDWERLDACSFYGCNTLTPFDAGSLRMAESGSTLAIMTCHTMYTTEDDGLNHQASMQFYINTEDMSELHSQYLVEWYDTGYASHSFNQFVRTAPDGSFFLLNHGDAYPRSIELFKDGTYVDLLPISGNIGDNSTGVSVGAMEVASDTVLVAYNSVDQDPDVYYAYNCRNIFLGTADHTLSDLNNLPITSYTEEDNITVSTPHLVNTGDDRFLLLWGCESDSDAWTSAVLVDGTGAMLTDIAELDAELSDCAPIMYNDCVTWYTTDGSGMYFYSLDPDQLASYDRNAQPDYLKGDTNLDGTVSVADVISVNKYYMHALALGTTNLLAADYNEDGNVDLDDSLLILKSLIGLA